MGLHKPLVTVPKPKPKAKGSSKKPSKPTAQETVLTELGTLGKKAETLFGPAAQGKLATRGNLEQSLYGMRTTQGRQQSDIERLRGISQTKGLTESGKALTAQQQAEQAGLIDRLGQEAATREAGQFSQLAQLGGAAGAARERMAGSLAGTSLREAQEARRQGALARLGISSQDEQTKLSLAQNLPGLESQLAGGQLAGAQTLQGASQFDVASQLGAAQSLFGGQSQILGQKGSILGAEQLSRAQSQLGKPTQPGVLGQLVQAPFQAVSDLF